MALFRRLSRSAWQARLVALALAFLVMFALLVDTLYAGFSVQQSVSPRPSRTIPNTDVNPYGANFFLSREVEPWKLDKTLRMASEAGIGWVKQQFPWEEIEPRRKGEFLAPATQDDSWTKYDQIVAACEKYGLKIVARLDRPPDWTRQDNSYKERPPDNFEDYGDFVYAFVKHYQGHIGYIQIWNEPNIFPEWGNRPVDPAQYVELLKVAYRRAKEANPNVYVLCAPLAMTLGQAHPDPGKWTAMNDLTFLEEMYKAGVKDYFDVYSANAFGMDRPPEDPPDPNVLNFQRVLLQREIMVKHGDEDKPVWFDEYGWNASPESFPKDRLVWQRVSEKEQAEYGIRGIELARRDWPWAGVFMFWYFRQVGNVPVDRADYYFRIVDVDFTPRELYRAIQKATTLQDPPGPGWYQESNPQVKLSGHWQTVIDSNASGHAYMRSDTAGDSVEFSFYGSEIDLITRRWKGAGRLLVWVDDRPVAGLPTDGQGASYVELYSIAPQTQARVRLMRANGPGKHTLRVVVAADQHPSAIGAECVVDGFDVIQGDKPSFPIMPMLGIIFGLGLDGWLLQRTWRRVRWVYKRP